MTLEAKVLVFHAGLVLQYSRSACLALSRIEVTANAARWLARRRFSLNLTAGTFLRHIHFSQIDERTADDVCGEAPHCREVSFGWNSSGPGNVLSHWSI